MLVKAGYDLYFYKDNSDSEGNQRTGYKSKYDMNY